MQERLDRKPDAMRIRRATVEHPFGTLKAWMGATHFKTRTLEKVRTEMSLHVLAYNLKRVIADPWDRPAHRGDAGLTSPIAPRDQHHPRQDRVLTQPRPCVDGTPVARAFLSFCRAGWCGHVYGL